MKKKLKTALVAFGFAVFASFAFSSCETAPKKSSTGVHNMGSPASGNMMPNEAMPGYH